MSKIVKYLPQQNYINLETPIETDTHKTLKYTVVKGSRRSKFRSFEGMGTVDLRFKSSYIITNKKKRLIQRILILRTRRNKRPAKFQCVNPRNFKIPGMNRNSQMSQTCKYTNFKHQLQAQMTVLCP